MRDFFTEFKNDLKNKNLVLILAIGFILRISLAYYWPLKVRGAKRVNVAMYIYKYRELPLYDLRAIPFSNTPFHQILLSLPLSIFDGKIGIHYSYFIITPILGTVIIYFVYRLAIYTHDEDIAMTSAFITAFLPFLLIINMKPTIETTITLIFLIGIYLYVRYLDVGDNKYLLSSFLFAGLAAVTKIFGPLLFIIISTHQLYIKRLELGNIKKLIIYGIAGMVIPFPWWIRNIYYFGNPYARDLKLLPGSVTVSYFKTEPLLWATENSPIFIFKLEPMFWIRNLVVQYLFPRGVYLQSLKFFPLIAVAMVITSLIVFAALIYGLYLDRNENNHYNLFLIWVIVNLTFLIIGTFYFTGLRPKWRHITTITPYSAILLALIYEKIKYEFSISSIQRVSITLVRAGFAIAVILSAISVGSWVAIQNKNYMTEKKPVVRYINQNVEENAIIYMNPSNQFSAYTFRPGQIKSANKLYNHYVDSDDPNTWRCILKDADYLILAPMVFSFDANASKYAHKFDSFHLEKRINGSQTQLNQNPISWEIFKRISEYENKCKQVKSSVERAKQL